MTAYSRREMLRRLGGTAAATALAGCGSPVAEEQPNIIFIMVDDLGIGDLGCHGQQLIQTPHIDRLADEGVRFTRCYSGSAVCGPTRCVLMTGLHTGHCTRRDNTAKAGGPFDGRPLIPLQSDDFTVAAMLQQAGYVTGGMGKWGLGNPGTTGTPDQHGFDHFFGYLDQVHAHSYYPDWLWNDGAEMPLAGNKNGAGVQYSQDLCAEEALRFIRDNQKKPFFLYLPYTIPHGKYEVPDLGVYADRDWTDEEKIYAAMISRMDADVGDMMQLLEDLGIDERTIVFFTSDNGPVPRFLPRFNSGLGLRGVKRALYEGGIRAPMIVRWPGRIAPGAVSDFTWSQLDFMPTAAALAGTTPPANLDGMSVLPAILGQTQTPHDMLYWEIHSPFHQAALMGRWKAVRFGTETPLELYHLDEDPHEQQNVADSHPEVVRTIEDYLRTARTETPYWPTRPDTRERNVW